MGCCDGGRTVGRAGAAGAAVCVGGGAEGGVKVGDGGALACAETWGAITGATGRTGGWVTGGVAAAG